jgi:ATP-dependent DNA ligase
MPKAKAGRRSTAARVKPGAVPPEALAQSFPSIPLPIQPPYPPAEAKSVAEIPSGPGWLYEPKWEGFRCLVFRHNNEVLMQSKAGQPQGRYFPELVAAVRDLARREFVLDGEIFVFSDGHLSFDDLLLRIHPAESRIRKLSTESPATLMCFDLLVDKDGKRITDLALSERRRKLEVFFRSLPAHEGIRLSPASADRRQAEQWMHELASRGLDGIVAKRCVQHLHEGARHDGDGNQPRINVARDFGITGHLAVSGWDLAVSN